jgi:dihydrodipicolinate synthase/N-acetylneuraminate lyase
MDKYATIFDTAEVNRRVIPRRKIEGISAVLLPFDDSGLIDFDSFSRLLTRTLEAGLTPAVNMDTGYVNLLPREERGAVLKKTQALVAGRPFVAGAFIEGEAGDPLALYQREVATIQAHGGTPILFQCSALKQMAPEKIIALYRAVAAECERLLAFELGEMFVAFGQIYSLEVVRELMQIPQIVGMKHSSLNRELEWQRLALRDEVRPDFKIYTGNDLAIDMVMYGSDYLLGLSAFAPEAFAARDALWAAGDAAFYELNDLLQYLGFFAFRPPVPAYKHTAAQFLKLRGLIACDAPHPKAAHRPASDVEVLRDINERLNSYAVTRDT